MLNSAFFDASSTAVVSYKDGVFECLDNRPSILYKPSDWNTA
jgi:hypothetical protein